MTTQDSEGQKFVEYERRRVLLAEAPRRQEDAENFLATAIRLVREAYSVNEAIEELKNLAYQRIRGKQ